MKPLYLKELEITPTSALSFRKLPMSHKVISSYSFIPPTVLSGFLYRLIRLYYGKAMPRPRVFKNGDPVVDEYFILENPLTSPETKGVFCLGAYPTCSANFTSIRMGYQDLSLGITFASDLVPFRRNRDEIFSLLSNNSAKIKDYKKIMDKIRGARDDYRYYKTVENVLLFYEGESSISERMIPDHSRLNKKGKVASGTTYDTKIRRAPLDWEFTVANSYAAYLVSENQGSLSIFDNLQNYGHKIGKEGFAYIPDARRTQELVPQNGKFRSSTIIPLDPNVQYASQIRFELLYFFNGKSFSKGMFAREGYEVTGDFFSTPSNHIHIPKITLTKLGCLS